MSLNSKFFRAKIVKMMNDAHVIFPEINQGKDGKRSRKLMVKDLDRLPRYQMTDKSNAHIS